MPGYELKHEQIAIQGAPALTIRSLLNKQQFADPQGDAQALGISSAQWPLFGLVWPSGIKLATQMAVREMVPGERILEIGCGLALASLVCHRRGSDVTASDCHPLSGHFLGHNLRLNDLVPMSYRHGDWASDDSPFPIPGQHRLPGPKVSGRFDLIMGSDVLYERDEAGVLASFIARHATVVGEVMIIDPNRGNRAAFSRHMRLLGYALQETLLHHAANSQQDAYNGRMLQYRRT
jgi:predicted nicotinamide N-methyase